MHDCNTAHAHTHAPCAQACRLVSRSRLVVASCVPTAWRFFVVPDRTWRFFVSWCGATVPVAFLLALVLWPALLGAFLWDAVNEDGFYSTDDVDAAVLDTSPEPFLELPDHGLFCGQLRP